MSLHVNFTSTSILLVFSDQKERQINLAFWYLFLFFCYPWLKSTPLGDSGGLFQSVLSHGGWGGTVWKSPIL